MERRLAFIQTTLSLFTRENLKVSVQKLKLVWDLVPGGFPYGPTLLAVNRPVLGWLKRNFAFFSAVRADSFVILARGVQLVRFEHAVSGKAWPTCLGVL